MGGTGNGITWVDWGSGTRTNQRAYTPVHTGSRRSKEARRRKANPAHMLVTCGSGPLSRQIPDGCTMHPSRGPKGGKRRRIPDGGKWCRRSVGPKGRGTKADRRASCFENTPLFIPRLSIAPGQATAIGDRGTEGRIGMHTCKLGDERKSQHSSPQ